MPGVVIGSTDHQLHFRLRAPWRLLRLIESVAMDEQKARPLRFTTTGSILGAILALGMIIVERFGLAPGIIRGFTDPALALWTFRIARRVTDPVVVALGVVVSGATAGFAVDIVLGKLPSEQRLSPPTKMRVLGSALFLASSLFSLLGGIWTL